MPMQRTGTRPPPTPQVSQNEKRGQSRGQPWRQRRGDELRGRGLAESAKNPHMNLADVFIFLATWNLAPSFLSALP